MSVSRLLKIASQVSAAHNLALHLCSLFLHASHYSHTIWYVSALSLHPDDLLATNILKFLSSRSLCLMHRLPVIPSIICLKWYKRKLYEIQILPMYKDVTSHQGTHCIAHNQRTLDSRHKPLNAIKQ